MRKTEIEEVLNGKGEFVQIDYLTRFLKEMPPLEMRKFAYSKLAEIYDSRKMYSDSANCYRNLAINSITFKDKIKYFIESAKAHIKNFHFEEADLSLKRALGEANSTEKKEVYAKIINFYKEYGEKLEKDMKQNNAVKVYEKVYRMHLKEEDKEEIKQKLISLYERLGKTNEIKLIESV